MSQFVHYTDEGPRGPCGQSCSTTNPWDRVLIFQDDENMRNYLENMGKSRRNPKVKFLEAIVVFEANGQQHFKQGDGLAIYRRRT